VVSVVVVVITLGLALLTKDTKEAVVITPTLMGNGTKAMEEAQVGDPLNSNSMAVIHNKAINNNSIMLQLLKAILKVLLTILTRPHHSRGNSLPHQVQVVSGKARSLKN